MKKEFIVNRQGKDFALYAGLLDQAHREGLKRITTKLLQAPNDENGQLAICYAEVETEKGVFSGIGDATPQNVGRMIAPHAIRMAETRAKARALRDAINVGVTSVEELGDFEEEAAHASPHSAAQRPARQIAALPRPEPVQALPRAAEAPREVSREAPRMIAPPVRDAVQGLATPQQIDRLLKLQVAVGRQASVPEGLSFEEAAGQITELVGIFNAQARTSRRSGA